MCFFGLPNQRRKENGEEAEEKSLLISNHLTDDFSQLIRAKMLIFCVSLSRSRFALDYFHVNEPFSSSFLPPHHHRQDREEFLRLKEREKKNVTDKNIIDRTYLTSSLIDVTSPGNPRGKKEGKKEKKR